MQLIWEGRITNMIMLSKQPSERGGPGWCSNPPKYLYNSNVPTYKKDICPCWWNLHLQWLPFIRDLWIEAHPGQTSGHFLCLHDNPNLFVDSFHIYHLCSVWQLLGQRQTSNNIMFCDVKSSVTHLLKEQLIFITYLLSHNEQNIL